MLYQIMAGNRRPSPEAALRIEAATGGAVKAAELLGVAEARTDFQHDTSALPLGGGRWSVRVSTDGSLSLPPEMVDSLGFSPGEALLFAQSDKHIRVHSADRALKEIQAELRGTVPEGVSVVDELIAERRREASLE